MTEDDFDTQLLEKLGMLSEHQGHQVGLSLADVKRLGDLVSERLRSPQRANARVVLRLNGERIIATDNYSYDVPKAVTDAEAEQIARFFNKMFAAGERRRALEISRLLDYRSFL